MRKNWHSLKRMFFAFFIDYQSRKLINTFEEIERNNFEKNVSDLLFKTLSNAQVNVPYYRKLMKNMRLDKRNIISDLGQMPVLTKEIIRLHDKEMFSEKFNEEFKYWMNTGGSTGEPLKFPVSANFELLHQKCLYHLMGRVENDVIVSVDGSRISKDLIDNNTFWLVSNDNLPYGSVHYSTLFMNDENLSYYINHLNKLKPALMRGYPSGIEKIAMYIITNRISLEFNLKGIYLTSEFFDNSNAQLLRKAFNCPVYGQYGHSEVSIFAFTLADSLEYFCSPLYGYTEVLDENGNHVKPDESGEIVVTGYSNKVMPFVRYRIGDIAIYGGTTNGVVKLKSLQGRSVDYIINSDLKKVYLTGLIFGGHLKSFEKIKLWQIEQNEPGYVRITIVKETEYTEIHENEIVQLFLNAGFKSQVFYVNDIPLTDRGKRKFLIQNISTPS